VDSAGSGGDSVRALARAVEKASSSLLGGGAEGRDARDSRRHAGATELCSALDTASVLRLSVAYSGVPILYPCGGRSPYYNVRYGLELLPAFTIFAALPYVSWCKLAAAPGNQAGCAAAVILSQRATPRSGDTRSAFAKPG